MSIYLLCGVTTSSGFGANPQQKSSQSEYRRVPARPWPDQYFILQAATAVFGRRNCCRPRAVGQMVTPTYIQQQAAVGICMNVRYLATPPLLILCGCRMAVVTPCIFAQFELCFIRSTSYFEVYFTRFYTKFLVLRGNTTFLMLNCEPPRYILVLLCGCDDRLMIQFRPARS